MQNQGPWIGEWKAQRRVKVVEERQNLEWL